MRRRSRTWVPLQSSAALEHVRKRKAILLGKQSAEPNRLQVACLGSNGVTTG